MTAGLRLRPAGPDDCEAVWRWRNDPASRAASLDTAEVPYAVHQAWFARTLADPDRSLLVGVTAAGERVGMVRLDRPAGGGATRISLNIAPQWRGRGAGRTLLSAAVATGGRFTAEVRAENAASIRLFESCGFARRGEADGVILFERS